MGAEITVRRSSKGRTDRLRRYSLIVDGDVVARIRHGESATVTVTPGRHRIWMRIDWGRSPRLSIDLAEGQHVVLTARSGIPSPLFGIVYATILSGRYIKLEEERRETAIEQDLPPVG